jgi:hypothetical protein
MEYVPGKASQRPTRGRVTIVATDAMAREAYRLMAHAAIISAPKDGYRSNALEVAYVLSGQLHVPCHNLTVTHLSSTEYLADFKMPAERDRALCKGYVNIGGDSFPIHPWRSAGGSSVCTWWYHVEVTMENVPLEAWNEDGVKLILGDVCIFDKLDSRTLARESSDLLTCWVWMEDPDALPLSMEYDIFAAKAGQAMEIGGLPSPTRIPSSPPVGKAGEKVIIIHLAGYEDWSPSSRGATGSGTSLEHGSSGPKVVPFAWAHGVLDGRPAPAQHAQPGGCRLPAARRNRDPDDEYRRPRPQDDVPRTSKVRQRFPAYASERAIHIRTRSPPSYRRALVGDVELMDRGRTFNRSPLRSEHGRDFLPHASEDWERRRSRSPAGRVRTCDTHDTLGLQVPASVDPLLEQDLGTGGRGWHAAVSRDDDPMLHEFLRGQAIAALAPNFAPDDDKEVCGSPASGLQFGGASTHPEARQPEANCRGGQEEITLETGVQLAPPEQISDEAQLAETVNMMDIDAGPLGSVACRSACPDSDVVDLVVTADTKAVVHGAEDDGGCASFCRKIFREIPEPLLPAPPSAPPHAASRTAKPRHAPARAWRPGRHRYQWPSVHS